MSRLRKSFLPFSWNPVAIIFTQGTSASINLSSYLKNDRNYPITYSLIGTLQSGVTHSNGTVTYNGAGGAATTTVQFRATSGSYVADSAATVSIVATQVNRAPVWDTPSGSVGTFAVTGGTRAVQLSATDPDGDPVTYSRTGSAADTAPGSFAVTYNGLLTIPENVAASTYTIEVRASDGLGGQTARQFTATVQAAAGTGSTATYPRIAAGQIGGFGTTFDSARWNTVAKYQVAIIGGNRWVSLGGTNLSGLATYLKNLNSTIKLFKYTNVVETYYQDTTWAIVWQKLGAEKGANGNGDWWLRTAAGAQIQGYATTQRRTNFTSLVTPDANGWRWPQWFARFWYWGAGKLPGLTGQGIENGPWDGVYEDNQYTNYAFTATADYNEDGVDESGTSTQVVNWVIDGHVAYHDAYATIAPNLLFAANQSAYLHPTAALMDDRLKAINDCGWMEDQSKMDNYFGWATMMQRYRDGLSWLVGPKYGMFDAHLYRFVGWFGSTEERWNRYFLCSALMDDGWYMPTTTDNGYGNVVWCDEFDHNLGLPVAGASGAVQTAAWSNGVYRREFRNGLALVNPRGNGNQTVMLPAAGTGYEWRRLNTTAWASGTVLKNATVNTGAAQGSSLTISDGTGLILRRVAV